MLKASPGFVAIHTTATNAAASKAPLAAEDQRSAPPNSAQYCTNVCVCGVSQGVLGYLADTGRDEESKGLSPFKGETGMGGDAFLSWCKGVWDTEGEDRQRWWWWIEMGRATHLGSSLIASVSEFPIAGLMLSLENDTGLSRKEVDALGLGTGDGLGETSGDDATVIGGTSRRGKTKSLSFRAGREWFRIAMVAYSGCDVVSAGSFARKRKEEESERKEKEDREGRWNVPIFRQHELHPDHFPPSIVTLLAIESRRHQCPVPNGGVNERFPRSIRAIATGTRAWSYARRGMLRPEDVEVLGSRRKRPSPVERFLRLSICIREKHQLLMLKRWMRELVGCVDQGWVLYQGGGGNGEVEMDTVHRFADALLEGIQRSLLCGVLLVECFRQ